jgi:hypothetical protein
MQATAVLCDAAKADGGRCGARAVVIKAENEFDILMYHGPGGLRYSLRELRYEIECPNCGRRMQVERFPPAQDTAATSAGLT